MSEECGKRNERGRDGWKEREKRKTKGERRSMKIGRN